MIKRMSTMEVSNIIGIICCTWFVYQGVQAGSCNKPDNEVARICYGGTRTGEVIYLEADLTEQTIVTSCSCTVTVRINAGAVTRTMDVFPQPQTRWTSCFYKISFQRGLTTRFFNCLNPRSPVSFFNMTNGDSASVELSQYAATTNTKEVSVCYKLAFPQGTTDSLIEVTCIDHLSNNAATTEDPTQRATTQTTTQSVAATQPVVATTLQPVETTQPIEETTQLIAETTEQAVKTTQLVEETTQPIEETTQPIEETTQPIAETTQQAVKTTQTVDEQSTSSVSPSHPMLETTEPVTGTTNIEATEVTTSGVPLTRDTPPSNNKKTSIDTSGIQGLSNADLAVSIGSGVGIVLILVVVIGANLCSRRRGAGDSEILAEEECRLQKPTNGHIGDTNTGYLKDTTDSVVNTTAPDTMVNEIHSSESGEPVSRDEYDNPSQVEHNILDEPEKEIKTENQPDLSEDISNQIVPQNMP